MGPRVQRQSRLRLRRPATGVSGHESLSDSSDDDESRFSPVRGPFGLGESSSEEKLEEPDGWVGDSSEGALDEMAAADEAAETDDDSDLSEESESVEARLDRVELEDSMSEWAMV